MLVAEPIRAVLKERLDIQAFPSSTQKQSNQTDPQGRHEHEQLFLEATKRVITSLAKVRHLIEGGLGLGVSRGDGAWTRATKSLILTLHGAHSELPISNSKDMLHAPFQLPPDPLMAPKTALSLKKPGKSL